MDTTAQPAAAQLNTLCTFWKTVPADLDFLKYDESLRVSFKAADHTFSISIEIQRNFDIEDEPRQWVAVLSEAPGLRCGTSATYLREFANGCRMAAQIIEKVPALLNK